MLARFRADDGLVGYRSEALAARGVPHVFTTRIGPGGADLDAGALAGPARARLRVVAGAPAGAELVRARQVHGTGVWVVEEPERGVEADALVTRRPDRLVYVVTADCVPVLLAAGDGVRVAAVHAGWRGLVAGVLPRALAALASSDVTAAVGPCLSLARFEVGPEVAAEFRAAGLAECVHTDRGPRPHVDLRAAATIQLERAGVHRIDVSDRCTWEQADELWSHRRDVTHGQRRATGRLGALIAPHPSFGRTARG